MKVSFDFDSTLSRKDIQTYAQELVDRGLEVWIITSRFEYTDSSGNKCDNSDLFEVANKVGIKKGNIHFCNMEDKAEFIKDRKGYIWHLDDDIVELYYINTETDTVGILCTNPNWKVQCEKLLEDNK